MASGATSIDIYESDLVAGGSSEIVVKGAEKLGEVPWKTFTGHEFIGHTFKEITILFLPGISSRKR